MTRTRQHREKSGDNNEVSQDDCIEGTSARTRPLSYIEIMLRRRTKEEAAKSVANVFDGSHIELERGGTEKDLHSSESPRKPSEDLVIMDAKHISDDFQKLRHRVKDDTHISSKDEVLFPVRDSVFRDSKIKLKSIIRSIRASEGEIETHYERNQKNESFLTYGFDNRSDTQRATDSVDKDLVPERSKENFKRKSELVDNERGQFYRKTRIDRSMGGDTEEFKTRHTRDTTQADNYNIRRKNTFEKKSKHKYHYEGEKTISRTGKKSDLEVKGMESEAVYHEKPKVKRRRSRSREHDKERGRNSPSHSPKLRGYTSKYKKQHQELPLYSKKDRDHSDSDKKRLPNNGSSGYFKRKTGSSSGLGGYSPRKRKTDTVAKTPSPTYHSPEKKFAGWDLPPDGKESVVTGSTFPLHVSGQNLTSNVKEFPRAIPVTPTALKPIGVSHMTLSSQMHAVDSIQLTQATRPMRRLYVENLPDSATEKDLLECINNLFMSSSVNYLPGTQPCISCIIHQEKSQALLEFLTPADASFALAFDGTLFSGYDIKLRRPKDYTEVTTGLPEKTVVTVDSACDTVEDSPHKIFICGISKFITSEMLLEIVRVFGAVKAYKFQLMDDNQPCAFLEYVDHSVTSKACAGLNGMKFGGQVVTATSATLDSFLPENAGNLPFYGIPEHAKPLLEKPTVVLKLLNLLDPEGVLSLSDSELEEIKEDIKLECSRFGMVKSINIVRPRNSFVKTEAYEAKTLNASIDQVGESDELLETRKEFESSDQNEENKGCDESVEAQVDEMSHVMANSLSVETTAEELMNDDKMGGPNTAAQNLPFQAISTGSMLEPVDEQNVSSIDFGKNGTSATDKLLIKEELIIEEDGANKEKLCKTPGEEGKTGTWIGFGEVFETGSVLVEYKRAEASCMAAHNLHGRCFDGRVVRVAYVDHNLYQTRFLIDKRPFN